MTQPDSTIKRGRLSRRPARARRLMLAWPILLSAGAGLSACGGAPQYDATTDSQLTALQRETDSQMVQMIALSRETDPALLKQASYAQNIAFYNKFDTDLMALELRMEAVPDASTANLPAIFDSLRTQVSAVADLHRSKGNLPAIVWRATRNQLNAQYAVLMTYELSLKGVSSPTNSTTQSRATATFRAGATPVPDAN